MEIGKDSRLNPLRGLYKGFMGNWDGILLRDYTGSGFTEVHGLGV